MNINYQDYESETFNAIFSDFSKPFSERLDSAVEFANYTVYKSIIRRYMLERFIQTGCIVINSPSL